jgi:hypothetical protein
VTASGGLPRIAMPDLARVVQIYRGPCREVEVLKDPAHDFIDTNAHYIDVVFRSRRHQYLCDFDFRELRLREAGFDPMVRCEMGQSAHSDLCDLETRAESLLVAERRHLERRPPTERIGAPLPVRDTG